MSDDVRLEQVGMFLNRVDAELARGALEAQGIPAMVSADDAAGMRPHLWLGGVRVLVRADDVDRAAGILHAAELMPSPSSSAETTGDEPLADFARRYTEAWCSQDALSVASFFAENGSLTINDGAPAIGRRAIADAAQAFMTAFPDMVVIMDGLDVEAGTGAVTYRWTLTGTNTGPGGTGRAIQISGQERWTLDADGLIAQSFGSFDDRPSS
jgi:uncharacterized protein (TIGR02246 family)